MNAQTRNARVVAAQVELDAAHAALASDTMPIRISLRRHRAAWIVAGGLAGGFALSWLPPRIWARIGALVGGGSALLARSVLTPMIAGALLAPRQQRDAGSQDNSSRAR
jgi:hypothetical protein